MNDWPKRREPLTFMLYLGMAGSLMVFFVLFSVLLRNQSKAFLLPMSLWLSTISIGISSLSLYTANVYFKIQRFDYLRISLLLTILFSFLFFGSQISAWYELIDQKNIQPKGVILLLTSLHLAHIIGGIIVLLRTSFKFIKNKSYIDSFIYAVNPPNELNFKLLNIYWHFLGILWILILLFLWYYAS